MWNNKELLVECPVEIAETIAKKVQECMERAGSFYCKTVPLKAVPVITNVWGH